MSKWSDIRGHKQILSDFQALLAKDKMPHALLFVGIEGIGKGLVARVLAKALLCTEDVKPCDHCVSCQRFNELNHPDFYVVAPDESKVNKVIRIDQIRSLQGKLAMSPYMGSRQVAIIEEADTLNEAAMNALLKTLEEPTGDVVFILLTSHKEAILPTILSRCTQIYFGPLAKEDIVYLLEQEGINNKEAEKVANIANGSITNGKSFLADEANLRQLAINFCNSELGPREIWDYTDKLTALGKGQVELWGQYLLLILRDAMLVNGQLNKQLIYNQDIIRDIELLTMKYSLEQLLREMNLVENFLKVISTNADLSRALQNLMLKWREER